MTQFTSTSAPVANKPHIRDILGVEIPVIEACDVGAMAEGRDRYESLLARNMANLTGFEPNAAEFEKLQAKGSARKRYLQYFLGKGGPATFHVTRYGGGCSLYQPDPSVIDLFTSIGATLPTGNLAVMATRPVTTTRLDDVPGVPPFDYLKIDVQGAELDVLQGAPTTLAQAVAIEVEVEFIPLYKDQPLFGHVQVFLQEHNFVLHKFIDICGRAFKPLLFNQNPCAPMSQVLWADAVFVRNFANPALYSDNQLLKAAAILYEVYNSHDLVHHLLSICDRRHASSLASRFVQWMSSVPQLPAMYMNLRTDPKA
jgi:FkbM family methyltransferase